MPFYDNFNDNSQSLNLWDKTTPGAPFTADAAVTVSETSNRLEITPRSSFASGAYNGYTSDVAYDFTGKYIAVEVAQSLNNAAGVDNIVALYVDSNNYIHMTLRQGGGVLQVSMRVRQGGSNAETTVAYNGTDHRWWRIRHQVSGGHIYFDTSPDGSTWTNRRDETGTLPALTAMKVFIGAGTFASVGSPGTAIYDNFSSDLAWNGGGVDLSAGSLTITGQTVNLNRGLTFGIDPGSVSMTGQNVTLSYSYGSTYTASLDAGSLTLTGSTLTLSYSGPQLPLSAGSLTITGQTLSFLRGYVMPVSAGSVTATGQSATLDAQISEVFTLNFVIDVYVNPVTAANVVDHYESLTVDGTPISLKSWSFEETDQSIYGTLNAELNNLDQRSLLTSTASINFSVNGETLLDTGRMERKDYSISRKGIGAADTVTFVAMPEMEARLNTVPPVPLVLYDPERHSVTADDFEGIYDTNGNYDPPEVVPVSSLSFHKLLDRVMVDRCGFTDYITDIPDFPIMSVVTFDAGVAYFNVIGSICAMFNPDLSTIDEGGGPIFTIRNGTAGIAPGMPSPRQVGVSNASDLGVATELARVDSLLIDVTKDRFAYDYFDDRLPEEEVVTEGSSGFFSSQYTETTTTSYYRDYYRNSQPNLPVKSELIRQTMVQETGPFGGVFLSTDENFEFDRWGRVTRRTKVTEALMPNPFDSFAMGMIEVEREDETITYKLHPFEPRAYYTAKREINKGGIIVIDGENKQLGTDYARDIVNAYRSGNLVDTMTAIEGKISQFVETITPRRNKRIKVTNYEIDFTPVAVGLSPIFLSGDSSEKDGEVGVNIFVQEQQKMYIFQPGETEIGGTIERVNMGELPQEMAVALGERILLQRTDLPNRVSLTIPYIDMTLQRGTPINAIGRNGEDLGNYIIEARTLNCAAHDGRGPKYSMTVQAREA